MPTKLLKSAGRFGTRYGVRVKRKIADIESKQRKKQSCPFCNGRAIRLSKGIWVCKKCQRKFAGHAYYLEQSKELHLLEKPQKKETKDLKKAQSKEIKEKKPKRNKKTSKKTKE